MPETSETLMGSIHEVLRLYETNIFRRKIVILPIMHKNFSIPQFFWNIEGMPTNILGSVTPINFDGETWYRFYA